MAATAGGFLTLLQFGDTLLENVNLKGIVIHGEALIGPLKDFALHSGLVLDDVKDAGREHFLLVTLDDEGDAGGVNITSFEGVDNLEALALKVGLQLLTGANDVLHQFPFFGR